MVIGIMALLIAILLPAVKQAMQTAQRTACLSNLRQMAMAAELYVGDNDGFYPPAQWNNAPAAVVIYEGWDYTREGTTIRPGLLWQGRVNMRIQQCPGYDGRSNSPGDPYTGYNYNTSFIGRGLGEGPPAKSSQVGTPHRTILFGDGQWRLGANKYMRSPLPSPTEPFGYFAGSQAKLAGTQGFRHSGLTNAAFCDGHAESLRERYGAGAAAGTGFISEDNELYDLE